MRSWIFRNRIRLASLLGRRDASQSGGSRTPPDSATPTSPAKAPPLTTRVIERIPARRA